MSTVSLDSFPLISPKTRDLKPALYPVVVDTPVPFDEIEEDSADDRGSLKSCPLPRYCNSFQTGIDRFCSDGLEESIAQLKETIVQLERKGLMQLNADVEPVLPPVNPLDRIYKSSLGQKGTAPLITLLGAGVEETFNHLVESGRTVKEKVMDIEFRSPFSTDENAVYESNHEEKNCRLNYVAKPGIVEVKGMAIELKSILPTVEKYRVYKPSHVVELENRHRFELEADLEPEKRSEELEMKEKSIDLAISPMAVEYKEYKEYKLDMSSRHRRGRHSVISDMVRTTVHVVCDIPFRQVSRLSYS